MQNGLLGAAGLLAILLSVSGCRKESIRADRVRIAPSITRVDGVNFSEGDRIGVTIARSSGDYVTNRLMTYDGALFSAEDLVWYDDGRIPATFTAYYPYRDGDALSTFSVAADQRPGCASSDLLGAVARDILPDRAPVRMVFHHLLSQLNVVVRNEGSSQVRELAIGGFIPDAAVDLSVPEAVVRSGAESVVQAFEVTPDALYRVILVPQRATMQVRVTLADGTSVDKSIPDVTLDGGKRYDLSVVVETAPEPGLELTLSGEIVDWGEGGSIGGTPPDPPSGGETVEYAGESYATVAIDGRVWMAENLRYHPEGEVLGRDVWYPEAGISAVASCGLLYSYDAVVGGSVPASGDRIRGICPPGWHLPDREELDALASASSRPADFFTICGFWSSSGTGSYGDRSKSFLWGTEADGAGKRYCLHCAESGLPLVKALPEGHGLSLRCVKD